MRLKYFLLVSIPAILALSASGQSRDEKYIAFIRKTFQETNSEQNLEQVRVENEELTDEVPDGGVTLTGFFKGENLLKIELWTGLSYGIYKIEYYFSGDSLIFVYATERHFRQSGDTLDHSKVDLIFEGRYYFKNENQISKSTKGIWNSANDREQSLIPDSKNYQKFLYTKKKNAS